MALTDYENFLVQASGTKQVLMFPPDDMEQLSYQPLLEKKQIFSPLQGFTSRAGVPTGRVISNHATIDLLKPINQSDPLFRQVSPVVCTLQEGEILYIPELWHHAVHSTPNVGTGLNLGFNWWLTPYSEVHPPAAEHT